MNPGGSPAINTQCNGETAVRERRSRTAGGVAVIPKNAIVVPDLHRAWSKAWKDLEPASPHPPTMVLTLAAAFSNLQPRTKIDN